MKHARATSGSFYHFFPTKNDLLLAVLDTVGERLDGEVLEKVEEVSADPLRRVAELADMYREHATPGLTSFGLPIGALVNELGQGHREALDRIAEVYRQTVSRVSRWFPEHRSLREAAVDARSIAEHVVGSLEGAANMALASGNTVPVDSCMTQLRFLVSSVVDNAELPDQGIRFPRPKDAQIGDWKAW
jgi:TetR/AcrR family transcriptional repressor of nem operon